MRALTVINQQYPPEVASTGQIFCAISEYMAAHGWDVTVATGTPYYPGMQKKAPRREEMGGVHVRRLWNTTFSKRSFLGKLLNLLTFEMSLLVHCVLRIGKDQTVLVATAPPMAVLCTAIGRFFRRYRVVMTVQDLYPDVLAASGMSRADSLSYRMLYGLMRRAMRSCRRVATISTDMQRHLQQDYGLEGVALIPNLFPQIIVPRDSADCKQGRGWQEKLVVQYSGNFGVAHEYETLLGAARLLRREPDILFQIAGAGSNYDKFRDACRAQGLENVVFEGYAPMNRLESHLGTADVSVVVLSKAFRDVLLPSKYYGILASGRGVLLISGCVSDITRDIRREGVGLCFDHGQSEELAGALRALRDDPAQVKEMGRRARALYEARYGRQAILEAYDALLKQA